MTWWSLVWTRLVMYCPACGFVEWCRHLYPPPEKQ